MRPPRRRQRWRLTDREGRTLAYGYGRKTYELALASQVRNGYPHGAVTVHKGREAKR